MRSYKKLLLSMLLVLIYTFAIADEIPGASIFVEALVNGSATMPLEDQPELKNLTSQLMRATKSDSPVQINAFLKKRFTQQKHCGRIVFFISQNGKWWRQLGGQLNICEDGLPPWKTCDDKKLVPFGEMCPNGAPPHNTAEIQAAISEALDQGGLSYQTVRSQLSAKPQSNEKK